MKQFLILFFVVIILVMIKNFNPKKSKKMFTPEDGKKAILKVKEVYGSDMAKIVEKVMRLETAHFTSRQYQLTGSAGMEKGKWGDYLPMKDISGTVAMKDSLKPERKPEFYIWNSVTDFALFLARYIDHFSGNFARWNSLQPKQQEIYKQRINAIKTQFV